MAEGEPGLLVDLHLDDVLAEPELDRVLDGDDVHALALDHAERRVERGRLAGAGRPGHEDDALLEAQQPLDLQPLLGEEPEGLQRQDGRLLVQDPDDDLFAVGGGQGRDAEVHLVVVDGDPGPPVLRPQPVGDVEPRHDLDAGDERDAGRAGHRHDLPEHAVDAVAHRDAALDRLDVDVAGPAGHPVGQHHVHQPDDRLLARLVRGGALVQLGLLDLLHVGAGLQAAQQLRHEVLAAVELLDPVADAPGGGEEEPDFPPRGEGEHLLRVDIEGIGGGGVERRIGDLERQDVVLSRHALRHRVPDLRVHHRQVGQRQPEARGDRGQDLVVGHDPALDDLFPQGRRRGLGCLADGRHGLLGHRAFQGGNQPLVQERHAGGVPLQAWSRNKGRSGDNG